MFIQEVVAGEHHKLGLTTDEDLGRRLASEASKLIATGKRCAWRSPLRLFWIGGSVPGNASPPALTPLLTLPTRPCNILPDRTSGTIATSSPG